MVNRSKNSTAYYPKGIKAAELHLIENLRNNIDRKIVQYLLDQGKTAFYDIVNYSKRAPSTVSWHLNRLKDNKIVISTNYHNRKPQAYKIAEKDTITKILSKYTRTFV
jgi:predicted transcriptional regulator